MKIGILGTGNIGTTLAKLWAPCGHTITIGSRSAERAAQTAADLNDAADTDTISGATNAQAAQENDVVVFAFPWYALTDIERDVGPLAGKIIIDCINPMTSSGSLALGHKRSAGEEIAKTFPRAKVIKAFNTLYYKHLEDPVFDGRPATLYHCSDHDDAKRAVEQLGREIGLDPVDAGPIKFARYLEPLAVLWIQIAYQLGRGTDFAIMHIPRQGE